MDALVNSEAVPAKRKPPTTVLDVACAQIGGNLRDVAKKLGISHQTLYARLRLGYLDIQIVPVAEMRKWVELSRLEERVLTTRPGVPPSAKSQGN